MRGALAFLLLAVAGGALTWWAVEDVRQEDARREGSRPTARGDERPEPAPVKGAKRSGWPARSASSAEPAAAAPPAPDEPFPDELRTSDDGRWLEVVPLFVEDAGVDDDTTVIWQDESGLISVQRSKRDVKALPPPPRGERPDDTGARLLAEAEEALARGDFFEARRRASLARTWLPERPETYALLGRVAAAQNDVDEARWNFDRAEQYSGRKGLYRGDVQKMAKQSRDVGSLHRFETEHFAVSCEWAADEPNAILLREELERAWQFVAAALDLRPSGKFQVVVYRHEEFYGRLGATWWAAGDFDGRVRLSGSGVGLLAWRQLLLHELTHGFVSTQRAYVPGWLNEGLAQRVEFSASGAGQLGCRAGHGFRLAELPDCFATFNDPRRALVAYRTALHAVDRLVEQHGEAGLQRLVRAMAGDASGSYFTKALGQSLPAFVQPFDAESSPPEGVPVEQPSFE